jgi:hypothetical protein
VVVDWSGERKLSLVDDCDFVRLANRRRVQFSFFVSFVSTPQAGVDRFATEGLDNALSAPGVSGKPVELLTICPTLIDLCGLPENPKLEGVSLRPPLEDPHT